MSERNCHDSGARQAAPEYRRIKGKKMKHPEEQKGPHPVGVEKRKEKKRKNNDGWPSYSLDN
jgi:hypothetical protein